MDCLKDTFFYLTSISSIFMFLAIYVWPSLWPIYFEQKKSIPLNSDYSRNTLFYP